jgi:CubicO group peptidase (beta-lactamase class C family)
MSVDISGTCADKLGAVKDAFVANFVNNGDVGASVAVVMNNELVVDLWGGHQDAKRTTPWQRDTIINLFSTTKTMSCLALLVLASRGLVDVDAPVEKYWPEFGQNGKGNVLVRHLLSHTAGLPAWEKRIEATDLYDWDKVTGLLAEQATWWEPGRKSGYHALTQGNLVGEVVRRADGRTVGKFFADEIARPMGADRHIGVGAEHDARVASLIPAPPRPCSLAAVTAHGRRTGTRFHIVQRIRASWRNSRGKFRGGARRFRRAADTATHVVSRSRKRRYRTAVRCAESICYRSKPSIGSSTYKRPAAIWSSASASRSASVMACTHRAIRSVRMPASATGAAGVVHWSSTTSTLASRSRMS